MDKQVEMLEFAVTHYVLVAAMKVFDIEMKRFSSPDLVKIKVRASILDFRRATLRLPLCTQNAVGLKSKATGESLRAKLSTYLRTEEGRVFDVLQEPGSTECMTKAAYFCKLIHCSESNRKVIPTPSHVLDRISPIFFPFSPFFARFHRLAQTVPTSRKPEPRAENSRKHRVSGLANSGCWQRRA